jgi:hypothetical protein
MQRTGAHLHFNFAADFVLYYSHDFSHPPACSDGETPLKRAIDNHQTDVVALLRSVGASQ